MKKILLSGIKPTNKLTLGNYLGAIKNWTKLQDDYDCYFPVVDLHSITTSNKNNSMLAENTWSILASYLASGIDADKSTLFAQSQVKEHGQLSWILTCHASMGELNRMTQFKDKKSKEGSNIPAGLFMYPVLMAADILLYRSALIPVGEDQKQHVELTRDIAQRMNQKYGKDTFVIPEPYIGSFGARIMDLQNPLQKMGKSDSEASGAIYLTDTDKEIAKKVKRAVTDSGSDILYTKEKPGIYNLLTIQATILGKDPEVLVDEYKGKMYGHLKVDTADIIISEIGPIRDKMKELTSDLTELQNIIDIGRDKARNIASKNLDDILSKVGFIG